MAVSRRDILAAGFASLLPLKSANARLPSDADVAVLGAGMAGLAAAHKLMAKGLKVVVLEARPRIGGRAYTERDSFGVPFDHGCAQLHAMDRNPLRATAEELGFQVARDSGRLRLFNRSGVTTADRFEAAMGTLQASLDEAGSANRDAAIGAVLTGGDESDRLAMEIFSRYAYGAEPADISAIDATNRSLFDGNGLLPRGLGSMVMAFGLGLPISLASAVETIEWGGSRAQVRTTQGTVSARAVLVTASTGVLNSGAIRFDPVLPEWKRDAINKVPMGLLNKIALQYRRGSIGLAPGTRLIGRDLNGRAVHFLIDPFDGGLVIGFVGGAFAGEMEPLGGRVAIDYARSVLSGVLGGEIEKGFRRGRVTSWASDPWSHGSFSVPRPGQARMRRVLGLPVGQKLYFAGEATHPTWGGQLPGAYLSGLNAAQQIMADLA